MRGLKPPADVAGPIMATSHLLQMRGLKLDNQSISHSLRYVASFTDAWIETDNAIKLSGLEVQSHLLQMRGLKLFLTLIVFIILSRIFYRCVD